MDDMLCTILDQRLIINSLFILYKLENKKDKRLVVIFKSIIILVPQIVELNLSQSHLSVTAVRTELIQDGQKQMLL